MSLAALYALSTQLVAHGLLSMLEPAQRDPLADGSGQAIVVLGGGTYFSAPEYGRDTVSPGSLVRLRYAARLHRASGKPVLATGGAPQGNASPESEQMKEALERDFGVPVRWVESGSDNTLQNARLSYRLLDSAGVRRIYLVTHAWHMPRARLAFEQAVFGPAGMTATSFPTLEQIACVARGYTQDNHGRLMPSTDQLPWRGSPAGGGVATADDEVRFVEALKAGKLISLPMLTEAIKQQTDWYGYGFISSGPTEFPHWGHGGGARGNSAALSVYLVKQHDHGVPEQPRPAGVRSPFDKATFPLVTACSS